MTKHFSSDFKLVNSSSRFNKNKYDECSVKVRSLNWHPFFEKRVDIGKSLKLNHVDNYDYSTVGEFFIGFQFSQVV